MFKFFSISNTASEIVPLEASVITLKALELLQTILMNMSTNAVSKMITSLICESQVVFFHRMNVFAWFVCRGINRRRRILFHEKNVTDNLCRQNTLSSDKKETALFSCKTNLKIQKICPFIHAIA